MAHDRPSGRPPGRLTALFWLLVLGLTPLHAQEAIAISRAAAPEAAIRIYSLTGSLRVTAWHMDSVSVRGRVDKAAGKFYIGGTREALKLGVESADGKEPTGTADLEVRIPMGARLWVKSAAADIDITCDGGFVEVTSVSGRVQLNGKAREASVETLDGNTELAIVADIARARTASGTIVVRGVIQNLDASTVSGPLLVGMEGKVASVRLETVSSEIAFKGDLVPDGRLAAETHGGDVELRLPASLGAHWHLVSYGKGFNNEVVPASQVNKGAQKGEWNFTTGSGRASVDVRTFKGTITLKARHEDTPP
ncbi:MAG TPA: hypothetical protein VG817_04910 [Gemmatimonadales bacterium]|nr:hypothetical protein [Gemmatimonadales bacterium]